MRACCGRSGTEQIHLQAQVAQQRAEIERLKPAASVALPSPTTGARPADDQGPAGAKTTPESSPKPRLDTEDARTRLEREKWRRVAQAAEKAATQALEEAAVAKQEIEELRIRHRRVETELRSEVAETQAERDQSSPNDESQRNLELLTAELESSEASLAETRRNMAAAVAQATKERTELTDALATAKQEASLMEDLMRSEAAAMEANMMDAFQKDSQRELERMRQKYEAQTKEALAAAQSDASQAFAAEQAKARRDMQDEAHAAGVAAARVAEMTSEHAKVMLAQTEESTVQQEKLRAVNSELSAELEVLRAKHSEGVAAQAQVAVMAVQIIELEAARDTAEQMLETERARFETDAATAAEATATAQARTAERLGSLQEEVGRLQQTQMSLRDAEAELSALSLKCAEGVAAQAQVASLRASHDAAQVEMARLRTTTEEAEAKTTKAMTRTEDAEAKAAQAGEETADAQAMAERANFAAVAAQETEAKEVAAAQKDAADARTAMERAQEERNAAVRALETSRVRFEEEMQAAHTAHGQIIEQTVLSIVRDAEAKVESTAIAFNDRIAKAEAERKAVVEAAAKSEDAATKRLALLQEEVSRLQLHVQQPQQQPPPQLGDGQVAAALDTRQALSNIEEENTAEADANTRLGVHGVTSSLSGAVRAKPTMQRHPRSPERASPVLADVLSSTATSSAPATFHRELLPPGEAAAKAEQSNSSVAASQFGIASSASVSSVGVRAPRQTSSPHPSTPAPRKSHSRMGGPMRMHGAGRDSPVNVAMPTRRASAPSPVHDHAADEVVQHVLSAKGGQSKGILAAATNRSPTGDAGANIGNGARIYDERALGRLDPAVDQWVRASAITPPPASVASSSMRKDEDRAESHDEPEEIWGFDMDVSGELPPRPDARRRQGASGGDLRAGGRRPKSQQQQQLPKLPAELTCRPSVAEMREMSAAELAAVKDFTLVRRGYGAIRCGQDRTRVAAGAASLLCKPFAHAPACILSLSVFQLQCQRPRVHRRAGAGPQARQWQR